jgi:hypothetical protein
MPRSPLFVPGLCALILLTALPVFAALDALPPEQTQGVVTYRTGGSGRDEAQAFAAAATQYPLALEFRIKHVPRAAFSAAVHVTVADGQGTQLLDTQSTGPFLLAKIPTGTYTVTAEQQGKTLTKRVHVTTEKPAHVVFRWLQ